MSAEANLPPITCPSSLIASCAPLLGFEPTDCVVAFVLGVPGRASPVLVRADLPPRRRADEAAFDLAGSVAGTGGTAVDLVAWIEAADDTPRGALRSEEFLVRLWEHLEDRGVGVVFSLSTNGRVWWSHECPDARCCGGSWPLDRDVLSAVRAEYVYAGFAPLGSRTEIAERIARDPARAGAVARALARGRHPARTERWRDAQIDFLTGLIVPPQPAGKRDGQATGARPGGGPAASGPARGAGGRAAPGDGRLRAVADGTRPARDVSAAGPATPTAQAVRAIRGLADVVVRDTVLLRLIHCDPRAELAWEATMERLCDLVRCAPVGHGAPAATLLALVAWMRGEGALASVALERAEADDPAYRLADLTRAVIVRGLDPRIWRATMSGLTEAECRRPGVLRGPWVGRGPGPGDAPRAAGGPVPGGGPRSVDGPRGLPGPAADGGRGPAGGPRPEEPLP